MTNARLRLAIRLMRILARLCGIPAKRFDEQVARLDAMTPEEREKDMQENIKRIYGEEVLKKGQRTK